MDYRAEVQELMQDEESAKDVSRIIAQKLLADPELMSYLTDSEKQTLIDDKLRKEGQK